MKKPQMIVLKSEDGKFLVSVEVSRPTVHRKFPMASVVFGTPTRRAPFVAIALDESGAAALVKYLDELEWQ